MTGNLGFTGTRDGMTPKQRQAVERYLSLYQPEAVHHGDCVGSDAEFHAMCVARGVPRIVIHPPIDVKLRAFCEGGFVLRARDYIDRDHDIVDASHVVIATPRTLREERRSGTWATIRYARRKRKHVLVLWP